MNLCPAATGIQGPRAVQVRQYGKGQRRNDKYRRHLPVYIPESSHPPFIYLPAKNMQFYSFVNVFQVFTVCYRFLNMLIPLIFNKTIYLTEVISAGKTMFYLQEIVITVFSF
jgi:hypothetical protein